MKNSDLQGLTQDLNQGLKENKRRGGPSEKFKKEAINHGVKLKYSGIRIKVRDGYCALNISTKDWNRIFGSKKKKK